MGGRRLSSSGCAGIAEVSAGAMNTGFGKLAGANAAATLNAGATQWQLPASQQGMESMLAASSAAGME